MSSQQKFNYVKVTLCYDAPHVMRYILVMHQDTLQSKIDAIIGDLLQNRGSVTEEYGYTSIMGEKVIINPLLAYV